MSKSNFQFQAFEPVDSAFSFEPSPMVDDLYFDFEPLPELLFDNLWGQDIFVDHSLEIKETNSQPNDVSMMAVRNNLMTPMSNTPSSSRLKVVDFVEHVELKSSSSSNILKKLLAQAPLAQNLSVPEERKGTKERKQEIAVEPNSHKSQKIAMDPAVKIYRDLSLLRYHEKKAIGKIRPRPKSNPQYKSRKEHAKKRGRSEHGMFAKKNPALTQVLPTSNSIKQKL